MVVRESTMTTTTRVIDVQLAVQAVGKKNKTLIEVALHTVRTWSHPVRRAPPGSPRRSTATANS